MTLRPPVEHFRRSPDPLFVEQQHMPQPHIRITRRFHFSASHRYWQPAWTDEANEQVFGKNIHSHGHNYILEVTIEGPIDPDTGMILNLTDVKHRVNDLLEKYYDHRNLNVDHPAFASAQPTTERIALQLAQEVRELIDDGHVRLYRIRLWETEDLYAEVIC
ncbi:MAG: 6-carboxytetrahydropterin synthase [Candidatus Dadabacteria bacterium]|nr:MAG: 6-carboxytetrahydropterin synthase [Candidatus Dadabacteria bacterium]